MSNLYFLFSLCWISTADSYYLFSAGTAAASWPPSIEAQRHSKPARLIAEILEEGVNMVARQSTLQGHNVTYSTSLHSPKPLAVPKLRENKPPLRHPPNSNRATNPPATARAETLRRHIQDRDFFIPEISS